MKKLNYNFLKQRQRAKHFEKLYLEINHEFVQLKLKTAQLKKEFRDFKKIFETIFPPGHFYSPYPDLGDINKRKKKIFDRKKQNLPGIEINESLQISLLKEFTNFYNQLPYNVKNDKKSLRYFYNNSAYSYTDAIILFCMLQKYKPGRIIEIGSGYSSALMMDFNEYFNNYKSRITFIEPYPKLLLSLLKKNDKKYYTLIDKPLHEVDEGLFYSLQKDDVLFIDSTHVSKAGSDVNQIFFEILPKLKRGVIIHIHDIFYPFEYPIEWINETRAWNEDYLVRAFLHNNPSYKILLFNNFLNIHHTDILKEIMPLTLKNSGGSLWLQKI